MAVIDITTSLENLKLEQDAVVLYEALAAIEKEPRRADAFRRIAANERRHAGIWAERLRGLGATVPEAGGPRLRVRMIILVARLFGTRSVSEMVRALEGDEEAAYDAQDSPEVAGIAADEREHAEIWRALDREAGVPNAISPGRETVTRAGAETTSSASSVDAAPATAGTAATRPSYGPSAHRAAAAAITKSESWHRAGQSGTLRAVIFGVSDGLVSNTSLVMGVAGATTSPQFILLAGIAGLLAGAFSMAAGEYVSMQSQRELYQRQIALERAEMEAMPEEEEAELAAVYRAKGFTEPEAKVIAHRMFEDPEVALDALLREELGIDPTELGSPWGAAGGSFVAFTIGAIIPVIPYLFGGGQHVFFLSIALSLVAMFLVGVAVSLLTGRSALFSGLRQVAIGSLAAAVTFAVGSIIGVSVA